MWSFLRKLKIELPHDSAIPLLGIHPHKTIIQIDTCTPLFIIALFTIAKTQEQPNCPSRDEWIKEMWYRDTTGYHSAVKKNGVPFVATWMNLEHILLSEVSQKRKDKYHMKSLICRI